MHSLSQLTSDYLKGELADEQLEQLREMLREEPRLVDDFAMECFLDNELRHQLASAPEVENEEETVALRPSKQATGALGAGWRLASQPFAFSLSVAALVIFLLLSVMALMSPSFYGRVAMEVGANPPQVIARLTATHEIAWADNCPEIPVGGFLVNGRHIQLVRGMAEVRYNDGAVVLLEAPVSYTVEALGQGSVDFGKLVAQVPQSAHGFTVHTKFGSIVDLGTEFAVDADRSGAADVHVLTGHVEVNTPEGSPVRHELRAGQSLRIERTSGNTAVAKITQAAGRFQRHMPGPRNIAVANCSFEIPAIPDGRVGRHIPDGDFADWRTPPGWQWTDEVPAFGGLANPATSGRGLVYPHTDGDRRNGAMDGSQVLFFGFGVPAGGGLQQTLQEEFVADTTYQLRVAAGTRSSKAAHLSGRIRLLAGDHVLAETDLPPDTARLFREYALRYEYDPSHKEYAGMPLKIQLLRGDSELTVDFDNVRLYAIDDR